MNEEYNIKIRDAFTAWTKLDQLDVKILEAMSTYGVRNLNLIAKILDVPLSTVRFRVNRMRKKSLLFIHLNPYHTNMGLKKVFALIEARVGYGDDLLEAAKILDYYAYLFRIYGPFEGVGGIWTIPKGFEGDFERYLRELCRVGLAEDYKLYWSTCLHSIGIKSKWYDVENKSWIIYWDKFLKEIEDAEGEIPKELMEPEDWPIKVDKLDLFIINELQKDGTKTLSEIAKILNKPLPVIKYHWREHILKRDIIEGYQIEIYKYPFLLSELILFKFDFSDPGYLEKFQLALLDKPFSVVVGKVLGQKSLLVFFILPKFEFRELIKILSILIKRGIITRYEYYLIDIWRTYKETIPYEYFEDGRWLFDVKYFISKLRETFE